MTVSSELNRKEYAGNGVTTAFDTSPVIFFDASDLKVYDVLDSTGAATLKTITTDYTVSGGAGSTGTVTMLTAPASGHTLVIVRNLPLTQADDFVQNDASDAEVVEDALDRQTMIAQQLSARIDRSVRLPDSDTSGADTELPVPVANMFLAWNSDADALENVAGLDGVAGDLAVALANTTDTAKGDALIGVKLDATGAVARTQHDRNDDLPMRSDFNSDADFDTAVAAIASPQLSALQSKFLQAGTGATAEDVRAVLRYLCVSVKSFGATGDGTTDDTAAVQAAITAAESGRAVFFPDGNYRVTSALTIASKTGLMLFGERNARITFVDGAYTGLTIASTCSRVSIQNLEIYGSNSASTILTLLAVDAPYCKILNNAFANAVTGISLGVSVGAYIAKIQNNDFSNLDRYITMGTGAGTWNVDYDISGNTFGTAQPGTTNPAVTIQDGMGIRLHDNYFELQRDNKLSVSVLSGQSDIDGNHFFDSGGILNAGSSRIANNTFEECATRDTVLIDNTATEVLICGNRINESGLIANSIGIRTSGNNGVIGPNYIDRPATGLYIDSDDNIIYGACYNCTTGIEYASGAIRNDHSGLKIRGGTTYVTDPNTTTGNFTSVRNSIVTWNNAAATLTPEHSGVTNVWNTPLTADRAVTLSTTGAEKGRTRYRIVRTAASTGAFNLNVGTGPLKALGIGEWCDVDYDGSAYFLSAYGTL